MKLGSLKGGRDGIPVIVSRDGSKAVKIQNTSPSIREAIENWTTVFPKLKKIEDSLNKGELEGAFPVHSIDFHSPLPRSFQWADGSAFLHHVRLVRKARGADLPDDFLKTPLMYQGGSDSFLAPTDSIPLADEGLGLDFESEVAVITSDVPMNVDSEQALKHILLIVLVNDVSLRGLIPEELARGFGFFQSKPSSAFAPFAVTPDELGPAWRNGRIHLPLLTDYNEKFFGNPDAGTMHFSFGQLIAHAAKTRSLSAGTIIGSGTVSNEDPQRGSSCLAEKRMIEKIETGQVKTPFMKVGDTVKIQMFDPQGKNIFGTIFQKVVKI